MRTVNIASLNHEITVLDKYKYKMVLETIGVLYSRFLMKSQKENKSESGRKIDYR